MFLLIGYLELLQVLHLSPMLISGILAPLGGHIWPLHPARICCWKVVYMVLEPG